MKKEAIILRLLGLISLLIGAYWFWKTDFTLITLWGIPLPIQFILITAGVFTFITPAPFLSVVSVFLPNGLRERAENFSKNYLNGENISQTVFAPGDEGQVLADKLNKAVLFSKRRFYMGVAIGLIIIPIMIFYIIKLNEHKKENLIRQSDELVKAVQTNRLSFSSADRFRSVLKDTSDIKNTFDKSSTGRIHKIIDQLYGGNVKDEETFQTTLSDIYDKEIKEPVESNDFDFKKIKAIVSDTDSKDAKETLYILLAAICNVKGKNGLLLEPYLYGRGILNEITSRPSIFYHVSGWNYGGLFKSTLKFKIEADNKLARAAFPNGLPTKWSLAAKGWLEYKDYIKTDNSQLALVRSLNNVVDIHLPIIYFLRVQKETFQPNTDQEIEILKVKSENVEVLFKRLHADLDKTKNFLSDAVIDITSAQLYSLEGEVNAKENTAHSKDQKWVEDQRKKALERIEHAYKPELKESKEKFSFDNRETSYLTWLWADEDTAKKLKDIIK